MVATMTRHLVLFAAALAACLAIAPSASAALRSPPLVADCPDGSTYGEQTRGPFRLEGCLVTEASRFITASGTTRAELSGFDITLAGGERLALMRTGDTRVVSVGTAKGSKIEVHAKRSPVDVPLYSATSLDLTSDSGVNFDFDLGQIPGTARLLGLDVEGDVAGKLGYSMGASGTNVNANLKFPEILGGSVLAFDLGVTDGTGLQLNSLELAQGSGQLPFDDVPGAFLKDVRFKFTAPSTVTIGGKLVLPMLVPQAFGGTLTFNQGGLAGFSGEIDGLNVTIDPATGVFFLQGGSVNVQVSPLGFGGSIKLSAGPADATTGAHIYTYTGSFQFLNSDPSKITLTGTSSLLGIGNMQAAGGVQSVTYSSDQVLSLNETATAGFNVSDVGALTATVNADGSIARNGIQLGGSASGNASVFGLTLAQAGGSWKANGTGYGACLTGNVLGASVTAQGKADWGRSPSLDLGCNLNRFANRSLSRALKAGSTFSVSAGATNAAVRVRGVNGPPSFDLRLADGTVLQIRDPQPTASVVGNRAVQRVVAPNTVGVYVSSPPAGTWSVTEIAGQPLAEVQVADDAPPAVSAKVTGSGESRTLSWSAGDLGGGHLQLSEVQADGTTNQLVDTDDRTGDVAFQVPFGKAGTRRLVATITGTDGIPRATVQAGSYAAPRPFVPLPPRDVKASFSRGTLTFSQVPPRSADRRPDYWNYKVKLADGRVLFFQAAGKKKVKVRGVARRSRFTVSVYGIENEGLKGRARTERGRA
jgi:hypothetical protein